MCSIGECGSLLYGQCRDRIQAEHPQGTDNVTRHRGGGTEEDCRWSQLGGADKAYFTMTDNVGTLVRLL